MAPLVRRFATVGQPVESRNFEAISRGGRGGTDGSGGVAEASHEADNERGEEMVDPGQIPRGQRWRVRRMHAARSISSGGPTGGGFGLSWLRRPISSPASRSVAALSVHRDRGRRRQIHNGPRG